ncbi:MAG TPA: hypothetical protein VIX90_12345, partial [Edaphobacter sp.]
MQHQIRSRQGSINALLRSLLPVAILYLSTALTAHAQPNPNLMKYSCGPENRLFSTLSPTTRFTGTN